MHTQPVIASVNEKLPVRVHGAIANEGAPQQAEPISAMSASTLSEGPQLTNPNTEPNAVKSDATLAYLPHVKRVRVEAAPSQDPDQLSSGSRELGPGSGSDLGSGPGSGVGLGSGLRPGSGLDSGSLVAVVADIAVDH